MTVLKMDFAKEFVQSPSIEVLETCKKQIAQELQLEVKWSTRKHTLIQDFLLNSQLMKTFYMIVI